MTDSFEARLLEALARDASTERDDLVSRFVEHLLSQKVRDLADLEETRTIVMRALTKQNLDRIFERHVIPGYGRYIRTAAASKEPVGTLVPDTAREEIIAVVLQSKLPRGKWTKGAVDQALIRRLFAPVWTNLLLSFAKRLPIPGVGGGSGAGPSSAVGRGVSGIAGRITRSAKEQAERLVDAGKSVMGGLGTEVERRLQGAAKDFSDNAAEVFREALNDRLKSREGTELVAQISRQVTDHVLATKIGEIHEDASRIPVDQILRMAPGVVSHAAPRQFIERIVRGEIDAFLALEGERPVRELLTELGILDEFRAAAVARASALARGFFASPAFRDWLGSLRGA